MLKLDVIVSASFAKDAKDVNLSNSLIITVDPEGKTKGWMFWRGYRIEATVDTVDSHPTHPSVVFTMFDGTRKMGGVGNLVINVGNEDLTVYGNKGIFNGCISQVDYDPAANRKLVREYFAAR